MSWPSPQYSKSQVRKAGKRITKAFQESGRVRVGANFHPDDYQAIENWRASHGAVLNTAQAWLRRLDKTTDPVVGQRLKRYDTILDKLTTGRARDLSTMHDIAGVRAIFRNEADLRGFQERMNASSAKHELQYDLSKYDYIESPKDTGYRGVHQIYARQVAAPSGGPWNGLKFEVQLRTAVQHAWATAVEVYDSTSHARFKFEKSTNPAYQQFLLISELFARVHEGQSPCFSDLEDIKLVEKIQQLERRTRMVTAIDSLVVAENYGKLVKNSILVRTTTGELKIHQFSSFPSAIQALPKIEALEITANAVLVGATTPQHIRDAFRNYFDDTRDFVALLNEAAEKISGEKLIFRDIVTP